MNYRRAGNTGLTVSEIAYGSWLTFGSQVNLEEAKGIIVEAGNQKQLVENAGASGVQLSEETIRRLDELFPA